MKKGFLIEKSKIMRVIPLIIFFVLTAAGCESKQVAKGHRLFSHYCSSCHGEEGDGNGYNAVNLDPHPRDLTDSQEEYMAKLSNAEVYEVLKVGGYGVDLSGTMPVWGKVFSEEELWSVVAYVRTLHPNQAEKIVFTKPDSKESVFDAEKPQYSRASEKVFHGLMESLAPDEAAFEEQVALGEEVFQERGCIGCHVVNGKGGTLGPDLSKAGSMLQTQFIFRWVLNPQAFKAKTRMPNLDLNEEDAFAVSLYVSTLKEEALADTNAEHRSTDEGANDVSAGEEGI
mgnify:CR=1 FL=1